jgi:hypothetical protein
METFLHAMRYGLAVPLILFVIWLGVIAWHDGVGLSRKSSDEE